MTYLPFTKSLLPGVSGEISSQHIDGGLALMLPFSLALRETSYAVTLNQNCTITVGPGAAGVDQLMTIDLLQGGSGGFTPTFTNVSWPGGIAPNFNMAAGKQDMIQLRVVGSDVMGWPVSMGRLPLVQALPTAPATIMISAGVNQNSVSASAVSAFPAVSGYNVYAGPAAGLESAVPIASNVSLPFVESGLSAGTARYYKVAAVNGVGVGAMSPEAAGIPLSAGAVPGTPVGVTATAGNAEVSINAPSVSATPTVTGYTIQRGTSPGGETSTPIAVNVTLPHTDMNVTNGVTYYYTVAAVNSIGTSQTSSEVSVVPNAPAALSPIHYANFTTSDAVLYASPSNSFNPGANPFDMQAYVRMANWASSGYGGSGETCLWGCWDVDPALRLWRLGLTADGTVRASWATSSASSSTAISSMVIPVAGGTDLWIRATVIPTTGQVTFYTAADGITWSQLGIQQTVSPAGGVYTPSPLPYLVIGSNASGGSSGNTAEQFAGRFYEARLIINGALVTDPVVGAGGVSDPKGFSYTKTAGVGIV